MLFSCIRLFALEPDDVEGIWVSRSHRTSESNLYLAIEHLYDNRYFVLYVDPQSGHEYDYANEGRLLEADLIEVQAASRKWYIELRENGEVWHNMGVEEDWHAQEFRRVVGSTEAASNSTLGMPSIGPEDFAEHVLEQVSSEKIAPANIDK